MNFTSLGLSQKVLDAIASAGFKDPTPIQQQAIPLANEGRDIVGIAQTGTGKTASFVLPMLTRLETGRARTRMPRSLILEPTRELAAQVAQSFEQLGVNHRFTVALLIGGVAFDEQFRKLDRGADVLIATPGRLLDHFGRGKLLLNAVEILVIDEADRMLDMGFIPDIERICSLLPTKRQTLFFSATMPSEVKKLTDRFLNNPERIEIAPQDTTARTIVQRLKFAAADSKAKREVLRELIRMRDVKNAIIFCNRKRDVGILHKSLINHGFNAGALHGDMEQRARTATLDAFRSGEITYLAASDVAARGLDIPEVSHIFNFDVPISPEDYVHRIGRTGRAGLKGFAATIVTPSDFEAIRAIEKLCREKIEWIDGEPSPELVQASRAPRRSGRAARPTRGRGDDKSAPRAERAAKPAFARSGNDDDAKPVAAERAPRNPQPRNAPRADTRQRITQPRNAPRAEPNGSPVTAWPTASASQPKAVAASQPPRPRGRHGGQRREEETSVVGLGEHVPAFLMTPVRRAK